jgi:hypothetical protein
MTTAIAKKLAAVFGVGTKLTATYTDKNVTFSDGTATLKMDLPADQDTVEPGVYDLTVTGEESYEQVLAAEQPTAPAAAEKNAKPAARQGCNGFAEKALF